MTHFSDMLNSAITPRTVELPMPGGSPSLSAFPEGTGVRYFSANLSDPKSRLELERLLTTSLRCQGTLKADGDVVVVSETGSFDKDGCYNVVIKYFELRKGEQQ